MATSMIRSCWKSLNVLWFFNITWICILIVSLPRVYCDNEDELSGEYHKIEGRVFSPENILSDEWLINTRVLVNGGEHLGFLKEDGTFVVHHLRSGSYVVEVAHPDFMYEAARVDINSKGKIRARKVNFLQTSSVIQMPYPLKFKMRGPYKYFQIREQWRITDFLFNPMVLMMILPLVLIMILPKMMNAADPETQREMQQSLNMPKYDMPELSEMMTSFFAGGKKPPTKSIKASKKKQA